MATRTKKAPAAEAEPAAEAAAEDITDAEVVDDEHQAEEHGTALEHVTETAIGNTGAYIAAEDPDEIIAKAARIATSLGKLISENGLATNVGGRKPHVEVAGWQACGALLGALGGQPLHAEVVWCRRVVDGDGKPERTTYTAEVKHYKKVDGRREHVSTTTYDVDGYSYEARVEIRTPAAVVVGVAEAGCYRSEQKWGTSDEYAVRSMAETRAESRAWRRAAGWLVAIAGYNPTPAEEMPGGTHEPEASPLLELVANGEKAKVGAALTYLLTIGEDDEQAADRAKAVWEQLLKDSGLGGVPVVVAEALRLVARTLKTAASGGE
jgi:hypothetical protein